MHWLHTQSNLWFIAGARLGHLCTRQNQTVLHICDPFQFDILEKVELPIKRLFSRRLCPAVVCPLQGAGHHLHVGQPHLHLVGWHRRIQIPDLHDTLGNLLHQLHNFARDSDCHLTLLWLISVREINVRGVLRLRFFLLKLKVILLQLVGLFAIFSIMPRS